MKTAIARAKKAVKKQVNKEESLIDAIVAKVKTYTKNGEEEFNREAIIKYVALAIVVVYGLSKSGWLRGMILPAIATLVTERLVEGMSGEKEAAAA